MNTTNTIQLNICHLQFLLTLVDTERMTLLLLLLTQTSLVFKQIVQKIQMHLSHELTNT